ncbi:MAG: 3-deoxy-manno-octulosonate cytidylyltransferase [Oligoflexia bacterium]|nr:3-deoxy-manno-octulosonate cytidylyltransferase [Oligoflexia bacterium]
MTSAEPLKIVILIPARYHSSRFPGKPLAQINGKSMIERVYQNATDSTFDTFVVTDDNQIEKHVLNFGGKVLRVDDDVCCGTDRIHLSYQRFLKNSKSSTNNKNINYSLIINLQGDEPLLTGSLLKKLGYWHLNSNYHIATLVKRHSLASTHDHDNDKYLNPNVVKAIFIADDNNTKKDTEGGYCPYFSRSPIPHNTTCDTNLNWYQHIGVYSYLPQALETFVQTKPTQLEQMERLEQLRALSLNMRIGALATEANLIGVDIPEDIIKVENELKKHD